MAEIRVKAASICAEAAAPPSKSAAHRALIAAALSGNSRLVGILPSEDMEATLRCIKALGIAFEQQGDTVRFSENTLPTEATVDCGESGSTLRFFLPLFAALGRTATFVGRGRLPARPLTVYQQVFPSHGVRWTTPETAGGIVTIEGRLRGGRFEVAGDVSSQFITGLLMALPLCEEDSELVLTSPLQSAGYVDMTLEILGEAGIAVERTSAGFAVRGRQRYRLFDHTVEGDWSQAAFWLTAGALGGGIAVSGLRRDSVQGDRRIEALLKAMGAITSWDGDVLCCHRAPLRAIEADVSDIPDLVPVLAVAAATAEGQTRFVNAARLRLKESDRLRTTADMLRAFGVTVREETDTLTIDGGALHGGTVDGANDHRIVMAAAIAALAADGETVITDRDSVCKSWPSFFEEYQQIGGVVL